MISITGSQGFIGSALAKRLGDYYPYPRKNIDILYLFGSPSSDVIFKENIDYGFNETITGFLNAIQWCRDNKIKLIYPSSATVYNKNTAYARCKAVLEEIQTAYGGDVLGLRIFAGYGIGEGHKGSYASIVYQFCQQMKRGERPVIWGDGTQTRDFIYIDDIVDTIIESRGRSGIIDIGTGINTDFNTIVRIINKQLHTNLEPVYIDKPQAYVDETKCYYPITPKITIEEGIRRILAFL